MRRGIREEAILWRKWRRRLVVELVWRWGRVWRQELIPATCPQSFHSSSKLLGCIPRPRLRLAIASLTTRTKLFFSFLPQIDYAKSNLCGLTSQTSPSPTVKQFSSVNSLDSQRLFRIHTRLLSSHLRTLGGRRQECEDGTNHGYPQNSCISSSWAGFGLWTFSQPTPQFHGGAHATWLPPRLTRRPPFWRLTCWSLLSSSCKWRVEDDAVEYLTPSPVTTRGGPSSRRRLTTSQTLDSRLHNSSINLLHLILAELRVETELACHSGRGRPG